VKLTVTIGYIKIMPLPLNKIRKTGSNNFKENESCLGDDAQAAVSTTVQKYSKRKTKY
jgi:hypothetical protein